MVLFSIVKIIMWVVKILLVDNESKHIEKIQELLINDDVEVVSAHNVDGKASEKFDLIVLSGSQVNSVVGRGKESYEKEQMLLSTTTKPVIGLCAGYQLIVAHFGGRLVRLDEKIRGIIEIRKTADHPIFPKEKDVFKVYEAHRWVIETLPEALEGLASSDSGWEIIRHKEKPFYGFQFHPEVTIPENDGAKLFRSLVEEIAYV